MGLAIGAIWAVVGFEGALLATFLAAVGFVVAQVIEGRIDLSSVLGPREDR
ncbi:hypothetical protein BH18ACT4_BH18ACT4_12350 [soil metagenome]